MTGQAIIPISQAMGLHEIRLDLLVADRTDCLVKFGIAVYMAGAAIKRRTVGLELVGGERIPKGIV